MSVTSADLINLIADTMGNPQPPKGTKLALHTLGANSGKAYLVDSKANPLAGFDPIDEAIFSIESSDIVIAPPGVTPGTYKKTAYFQVNFVLNLTGDTKMKFGGVASIRTNYTDATAKGSASGKLTLGGAGQLTGKRAVLAGQGKSSQTRPTAPHHRQCRACTRQKDNPRLTGSGRSIKTFAMEPAKHFSQTNARAIGKTAR